MSNRDIAEAIALQDLRDEEISTEYHAWLDSLQSEEDERYIRYQEWCAEHAIDV